MTGNRSYLALLLLLLPALLPGQAARLDYGLKTGFNLALHYAPNADQDVYKVKPGARPGFIAGPWLEMKVLPHFAIGYELLYTQKGSRIGISVLKVEDEFGNWEPLARPAKIQVDYNLDYLELPVLMKVKTLDRGKLSLTGIFGTAFAYKVRSHHELSGRVYLTADVDDPGTALEQESDLAYVNSFDYSMVYGTALRYQGKFDLSAEIRMTLGWDYLLLPTFEMDDVEVEPAELRNQTYSAILSIKF